MKSMLMQSYWDECVIFEMKEAMQYKQNNLQFEHERCVHFISLLPVV